LIKYKQEREGQMQSKALIKSSTPALFFVWWYIEAPPRNWQIVKAFILRCLDTFSVPILIKTIFAPWKRDVISTENLSLNEKFQVMLMNLVSRFIGAVIRSITILIGLISAALVAILGVTFWIIWFFMPLIIVLVGFYGIILLIWR
jgi:hypothetical protein